MRVAFSGPAGCGKSTAAEFLQHQFGGTVLSFASPLKTLAFDLGWDGKKDAKGRKFLQKLGLTVREYNELYWVDKLLVNIAGLKDKGNYFVDDMRYPNEFDSLKLAGFVVVRLEPREFDLSGEWRNDVSETSLPKWMADFRIESVKGNVVGLRKEMTYFVECIFPQEKPNK